MNRYFIFLLFIFLGTYSILGQDHRDVYVFQRNGKKGLVNNKMEIVVKPKYEQLGGYTITYYQKFHQDGLFDLWRLGDNYSVGSYIVFKYHNKYGVMDLGGNWIIKPKYNELRYTAISGVFRYEENNKFGLLNEKGEEFIKASYEFVSPEDSENIIVKEGNSYFLIDYKGKAISDRFSHRIFSYDYKTKIFIFKSKNKYGYKRSNGDILFDTIFNTAYTFHNGKAKVRKNPNGKFGFVNDSGKFIVPSIYESVYNQDNFNGYYIIDDNFKYGLLNNNLKLLLKPEYNDIGAFNDGYAFVRKGEKYGFINENGKLIIPIVYDQANHFSEGLAPVKKNGKWGIINSKNKVVVDFKFEGDLVKPYSDGLAAYWVGGHWGYINKKGKVQIEPIYDQMVTKFVNGVAVVYLKGNKYLLNKNLEKFLLKSKDDEPIIEIKEVDEGRNN